MYVSVCVSVRPCWRMHMCQPKLWGEIAGWTVIVHPCWQTCIRVGWRAPNEHGDPIFEYQLRQADAATHCNPASPPHPTPPSPTPPTPPPAPTPPRPVPPSRACTAEGGDTWSTGSLRPCCSGLIVHNEQGKLICRVAKACTAEGGDEYSTGSLRPCCAGLTVQNENGKLICRAAQAWASVLPPHLSSSRSCRRLAFRFALRLFG